MKKLNRVRLLVVFLICVPIIFLIFGSRFVHADEGTSVPIGPYANFDQAPVNTQSMLLSQQAPTATAVAVPSATPAAGASDEDYPAPSGDIVDTVSDIDGQTVLNLVVSIVVVALIAIFGSRLIYALLKRITKRTETEFDDVLLEAVKSLVVWFIAAIGFQIATSQLDFLSETSKAILGSVYFVLYLFVAVSAVWRIGDASVDWYIGKREEQLDENLVNQVVPLLKRLSHIALVIIAGIVIAAYFGVNVLGISAALGLTGFAIALAAQDTIANIISGLVIMIDGPFKLGDRIEVGNLGTWGDVVEIGIRSSKVVTRDNRLVVVPNSQIVDSAVINYSMPDPTYRLQSDISIGYGVNIPEIQKMIKATVYSLEGVLPDKPVDVWFTEFADSSNTFRVRWWVQSYAEKRRSTDRVNAAVQELAEREGIDMPNPTYTLDNRLQLSDEEIQKIAKALKELE